MNRLHLVVLLLTATYSLAADAPKDVAAAGKEALAKLQVPEARVERNSGGEIVGVNLGRLKVTDDDLSALKGFSSLRWLQLP